MQPCLCAFGNLGSVCKKYKPLQFINTSLVISHLLFASESEGEAMKDERTH